MYLPKNTVSVTTTVVTTEGKVEICQISKKANPIVQGGSIKHSWGWNVHPSPAEDDMLKEYIKSDEALSSAYKRGSRNMQAYTQHQQGKRSEEKARKRSHTRPAGSMLPPQPILPPGVEGPTPMVCSGSPPCAAFQQNCKPGCKTPASSSAIYKEIRKVQHRVNNLKEIRKEPESLYMDMEVDVHKSFGHV